jgi:Tol biopolymer transport system component/DNA-binding winged helix-turn-helix (wHTH) protein
MVYRFDQFEIDDREFRFSDDHAPVSVEPKALRLLIYLIQNRNRLVRKQELLEKVWPDAIVTEYALTRAIGLLRKALNEDSHIPRYIETVPTVGYRFVAKVTVVEQPALDPLTPVESNSGALEGAAAVERKLWRWWPWGAGAAAVLVAGFFAWRMWQAAPSAEPVRAIDLIAIPGIKSSPSFSPDGNYVAFAWDGPQQDNFDIYVQQIGSGSPLRLTTDARIDYQPAWSPDGRWIAFLRTESESSSRGFVPGSTMTPLSGTSELRVISPLGGPERKVAEIRLGATYWEGVGLAWCPDSDCLVVTDSPGEGKPDALFVVSLETGEKRQLTHPQPPVFGDNQPAVSPDGRWLLWRREFSNPKREYYLLPLGKGLTANGEPRRLALNADDAAWMPDSKEIVFSAQGGLWRAAIPGDQPPVRLPFVGEQGTMPAVSRPQPAGLSRLVYVRGVTVFSIWRVDTSAAGAPVSSPPIAAIASTRQDHGPQFSPDGRRVAFNSNRTGPAEIWLADPDGSNAVQLTSMVATTGALDAGSPRWSPDGRLIAFAANLGGHHQIYVIPVEGGKPRCLTPDPSNNPVPSFSQDGKWIYFSSNRGGEYEIWKVPVVGGEPVQVTHNTGYVPIESPDGAYVYYTQTPGAPSALWRLPTAGGQPVKVLDGVVQRAFAVIEKGVYYIDRPAGEARLQFYDFATGKTTTVARNLGDVHLYLTVSPDGRTILYSRMDYSPNDLVLVEGFR